VLKSGVCVRVWMCVCVCSMEGLTAKDNVPRGGAGKTEVCTPGLHFRPLNLFTLILTGNIHRQRSLVGPDC
jgi:hypothetical protein